MDRNIVNQTIKEMGLEDFSSVTIRDIAKLSKKLEALDAYRGVKRDYPHPRSAQAIEGLAAYRGAQSGCNYAEAFQVAFRRITF